MKMARPTKELRIKFTGGTWQVWYKGEYLTSISNPLLLEICKTINYCGRVVFLEGLEYAHMKANKSRFGKESVLRQKDKVLSSNSDVSDAEKQE